MLGEQSKRGLLVLMALVFIGCITFMVHTYYQTTSHAEAKEVPIKHDVKGVYLNRQAIKKENIQDYIDLLEESDLNTVVIDVKDDSGKLTYDSNIDVAKEIDADKDATVNDMRALVKRLKQEGIYTVARIVTFKDPYLAAHKQEWAIRGKDGDIWEDDSGVKWIDPYKRDVWKYTTAIAGEAADFGFDEIQYDYIRFPENAKQIDDEVTYDNLEDISKAENTTDFLKRSDEALGASPVRTSADVFGMVTSSEDDMGIGQRWEAISPHVDYISPMTYPSHYGDGIYGIEDPNDHPHELVEHAMKDAVSRNKKLGDERAIIRPWVQDFDLERTYTVDDIKDQIRAMKEQGVEQYLVWNADSDYTKAAY